MGITTNNRNVEYNFKKRLEICNKTVRKIYTDIGQSQEQACTIIQDLNT